MSLHQRQYFFRAHEPSNMSLCALLKRPKPQTMFMFYAQRTTFKGNLDFDNTEMTGKLNIIHCVQYAL